MNLPVAFKQTFENSLNHHVFHFYLTSKILGGKFVAQC